MLVSITGMLSLMGLLKKGKSFLTDGKWKNLKDFLRSVKSDRRIQMVLQLGQDMLLTQNLPQERYFYKSSQRLQGPLSIPGLCTTVLLCTKLSLSYEVTHSTLLLFFFFGFSVSWSAPGGQRSNRSFLSRSQTPVQDKRLARNYVREWMTLANQETRKEELSVTSTCQIPYRQKSQGLARTGHSVHADRGLVLDQFQNRPEMVGIQHTMSPREGELRHYSALISEESSIILSSLWLEVSSDMKPECRHVDV